MTNLSPNETTVRVYNKKLQAYLEQTPSWYDESHIPMLRWIETSLTAMTPQGRILEIGSGPGRDAGFIADQGYDITCSDASEAFVNYLLSNGHNALLLDAIKDSIPLGFKMIFANAVVPHFTNEDFIKVIHKIYAALPEGGIFSFSVKQGDVEGWTTEKMHAQRYIKCWDVRDILAILNESGMQLEYLDKDIPGDLPTPTWALFIARKPKS